MMQGDACYLGIRITNNAGNPVTPADIQDVEITIGPLRKTYRGAQLTCEEGLWFFPLTQQETFSCPRGNLNAQVRIHWANGVVEGRPVMGICLSESLSREVI